MTGTSRNEALVRAYLAAWSTVDAIDRRRLVDQLYTEDAEFFADEPGDEPVALRGRTQIVHNITQVNERLTQGAGLLTTGTGVADNHDLVKVTWRMTTTSGDVAMNGMNLLTLNSSGMIVRDYIFIG